MWQSWNSLKWWDFWRMIVTMIDILTWWYYKKIRLFSLFWAILVFLFGNVVSRMIEKTFQFLLLVRITSYLRSLLTIYFLSKEWCLQGLIHFLGSVFTTLCANLRGCQSKCIQSCSSARLDVRESQFCWQELLLVKE